MVFRLIAEIIFSAFAVFGLYVLIYLMLCSKRVTVAIEIDQQTAIEDIPRLLAGARESYFLPGAWRVVALVDVAHADNDALLEALEQGGAEIYIIQKD